MNPAISNLVLTLVLMQVAKRVPFEDENVLLGVRVAYVLSNVLIVGLYLYTKYIITKKNGQYYVFSSPLVTFYLSGLLTF